MWKKLSFVVGFVAVVAAAVAARPASSCSCIAPSRALVPAEEVDTAADQHGAIYAAGDGYSVWDSVWGGFTLERE